MRSGPGMETWEKEGRTRTRLCFILNNNRRSPESSKSEMGTRGMRLRTAQQVASRILMLFAWLMAVPKIEKRKHAANEEEATSALYVPVVR